ncbi:MAG TPA: retroviral-like aspartic protease family protein [Candidatus Acidoferrum sp.]|nr:retroviral-like aspartic protease family protein [Candidatus Acidoferrum sp.]
MGTFRVEATVSHLQDRERSATLDLLVDTGATYTTLPREVADALGLEPIDTRRIRLGDGREELWPIAAIRVRLGEHECPSLALIGQRGGPALLGAVTLEELSLGVDPSARRLVPTTSYLLTRLAWRSEGLPRRALQRPASNGAV